MSKDETLRLALEALEYNDHLRGEAITAIREALAEQPAQQQEPVAYDKTEINCFAQDLYDQKMREGKRGHYESMFHVIHQCIKKVSPPQRKPLTDEVIWLEYQRFWPFHPAEEPTLAKDIVKFARAIEAAHGIKEQP